MNPYDVLGISPDASPDDIKKAYRRMAMKWHPDQNQDSDESKAKFLEIQTAYEELTKPKHHQDGFGGGDPFNDFFRNFNFSGGNQRRNHRQNTTYGIRVNIRMSEVYTGKQISVSVNDTITTIEIPKGVMNGQTLVIEGAGGREHDDLPAGDIRVTIGVIPEGGFHIMGHDLGCYAGVDTIDMILGTTVKVVMPLGETIEVTIPPNSNPNTRLRVKGKGLPVYGHDEFGDLYVAIDPRFPELSEGERKKLKKALKR